MTEVFKGQAADKAGVKVGDIILAVNGKKVEASQPGDHEVFDSLIRRLSVGGKATLKIVRDGKPLEVEMVLEAPPLSDENVKRLVDADFEFTARELSYTDRLDRQIPEDLQGRFVAEGGDRRLGVVGRAARRGFRHERRRQAHAQHRRNEGGAGSDSQRQAAAGGVLRAARHPHPVL